MNDKLLYKFKDNKKTLGGIIIIFVIITLITTSIFIITMNDAPIEDRVSITQTAEDVTISITDGEEPYDIQIKDPEGNIVDRLSEPGSSTSINRYSTDTIYGEYEIVDLNDNLINTFTITEPDSDNTITVTVIDQDGNLIENANVTISETTRITSSQGTAKFYDVGLGFKVFRAEAEGYESYRTNFDITRENMNISLTLNSE